MSYYEIEIILIMAFAIMVWFSVTLARSLYEGKDFFYDGTRPHQEIGRFLAYAAATPFVLLWRFLSGFVVALVSAVLWLIRNEPIGEESSGIEADDRPKAAE